LFSQRSFRRLGVAVKKGQRFLAPGCRKRCGECRDARSNVLSPPHRTYHTLRVYPSADASRIFRAVADPTGDTVDAGRLATLLATLGKEPVTDAELGAFMQVRSQGGWGWGACGFVLIA